MPRNPNLPRGRVDVECLDCGAIYEVYNHESWYASGVSDRCPSCSAVRYRRIFTGRTLPYVWGINEEWERWHKTFRDPLNLPNREPISYSKAMAYAAVHQNNTGESVSAEDIMAEVNTRYHAIGQVSSKGESS